MILVVMAAGMGSRFGGMKQLTPVGPNNELIMDYTIYDAISCGVDKVVFVIKEDFKEEFIKTIGKRIEEKVKVEYAFQKITDIDKDIKIPEGRIKPWGTGQALIAAKPYIDSNFITVNADDFYGKDAISKMCNYLKTLKNDSIKHYVMVSYILENTISKNGTVSRGVCEIDNNYLKNITERTKIGYNEKNELVYYEDGIEHKIDKNSQVSMNLFGFTKEVYEEIEKYFIDFLNNLKDPLKDEYYLPDIVKKSLNDNKADLRVLTTTSKYTGITYKEDLEELKNNIKELIEKGEYKENLSG